MGMDEVGLYTVKGGKIVEESFFSGSASQAVDGTLRAIVRVVRSGAECRTVPARRRHRAMRGLRTHTASGHRSAAKVRKASTAATGRLKNGSRLPSYLINDVTKFCSTIVPMTAPRTRAATG